MTEPARITAYLDGWEIDCCVGPLKVGKTQHWKLAVAKARRDDSQTPLAGEVTRGAGGAPILLTHGAAFALPQKKREAKGLLRSGTGMVYVDMHTELPDVPWTTVVVESIEVISVTYRSIDSRHYEQDPTIPAVIRPIEPDHRWLSVNVPDEADWPDVDEQGDEQAWLALSESAEVPPDNYVEDTLARLILRIVGTHSSK
jgi:hypothetical protein